jgi:hypothetical protein
LTFQTLLALPGIAVNFLEEVFTENLLFGVGGGTTMALAPGFNPDLGAQFANSQFMNSL